MDKASLEQAETLEFLAVGLLGEAMPAASRRNLTAALAGLRAAKSRALSGSNIIRKSEKLSREPAPKDQPNAMDPDATLGNKAQPVMYRMPLHMAGMVLHTVAGAITVGQNGLVATHPEHSQLHADLAGRGGRRLHAVDSTGKAATAAVQMFRSDRLQIIGVNDGFLSAMHRRADTVPGETRIENFDGPQPAATHCDSLKEFRRRYFGDPS